MNIDLKTFKCGYVAIIGKPNVGKSTLMNSLIGEKLSITTPKPQTTRQSIKGIYSDENRQIIFVDTPGFVEPRYELHTRMRNIISDSLKDADVVMFITDIKDFPTDYDIEVIEKIQNIRVPKIAILNKIDLAVEGELESKKAQLQDKFDTVIGISALKGSQNEKLMSVITKLLPFSPPFYDPENLSDLPMRFFVQELIREKIFLQYAKEIPYSSAVLIDEYKEEPDVTDITATIWIERDSQKRILIGTGGVGLKRIREAVERELTRSLETRVLLHLWVKVKKDWRKNDLYLKELGF
ncbi:MAG: GTPase Era [Candidatus Cloacimonetes bacterium]|nr:GTPase Era [Candidatus Cloacimonadota bacterium]